ncbi:RHS repeat-associated core domain-containing protein [Dysgonomonas alginatilytica]|uniref:RHS repeat-associated core domain-containing protein n=1 Tax=Dysgonomonas alginatilytica TaxID=1605892 RepID=UPI0011B6E986|nr:RHS repeat-associated core domain-containing protein [Dysgonomonas alginatilytica]
MYFILTCLIESCVACSFASSIKGNTDQQAWPGIFRGLFTLDYEGTGANKILKISEKTRDSQQNYSVHLFQFFNSSGLKEYDFQIDIPEDYVLYSNKDLLGGALRVYSTISRTYLTGDFIGEGFENLMYITHHTDFNDKKRPSTAVYVDFKQKEVQYNKVCFDVDPEDILCTIDFDGDGKSEIFHMNKKGMYVYSFDLKSGFKKIVDNPTTFLFPNKDSKNKKVPMSYLVGDINGDGKTDILFTPISAELYDSKDDADRNWTYYFSNGKDEFSRVVYYGPDSNFEKLTTFYPDNKYTLQDVDGNGLPDLVVLDQEGTVSVFRNIKGKFINEPLIAPEKVEKRSKLVISRVREANKLFPIMGIKERNLSLISNSVNQQENQLMSSSRSSYGVNTKYSYGVLTNKEVCTIGDKDSLSFPYNYLVEDIFVIKDTETSLNNLITSSTTYQYKNPVIHRHGLGFRGFEQITARDNLREKTSIQNFDPLMFGVLKSVQTPTMSVKNEYDTLFLGNRRVQVLLEKEVQNDILNGTTKTSVFEYDAYGNMTGQSVDYGEKIKSVRSNTLENINTDNLYLLALVKEEKQTETRDGVSSVTRSNIEYNSLYLPDNKKSYYNDNLVSEEKYKYDSFNNLVQIQSRNYTSENWLTRFFEHDFLGRVIKETNSLGLFTEFVYDNKNLLQSAKNHKGHITAYKYDAWGRNISTTYPDGTMESTSLAWTDSPANALIVSTTTATGQPDVQTYYDALGREVRKGQKRFDGVYLYTDNIYDNLGRIKKSSLPFRGSSPTHWNTYEYDSYDRIKVLNYASDKKDIYTYGKLQTRSDIDGVASIKTYDVSGQVISVEDAAGTIIYKYRPDGQTSSIVAPGNIETSFEYDKYGRQTAINDPSAGTKRFEFDAAGNIYKETDARGKVTKMAYDDYNRLTGKEIVGELTTTYSFNPDGLLTGESSSNDTSITYTYDDLFKLKTEKEAIVDGKWLQKTYTYGAGNLLSTDYTSQSGDIVTENYIYTNGHNTEIKLDNATSVWKLTGENNMGMPASSSTGVLSRTYGYNSFGLPTLRVIKNGTTAIQDFSYNIDPQTGNLTWRKDNTRNLREGFTYDRLNRLTGFGDKKMSYDMKGNITYFPNVGQFKYSSPKPYALTTIASCQVEDLDGLQNYRRGQTVTYTNMMRPLSISENNRVTTFTYNGNGDRVKMLTQRGDTTELERYYIGGQYEIDKTIAGTSERLYLGGDAYSAAAVYVKQGSGAWQILYIGRDYLGSITHVIDATGTLKQELSYNPWGRLRNPITHELFAVGNEIAPILGNRGYTGHEHLANYGLINMNARLYDPVVGRFLSPDPYVQAPDFSQNFNRYSYCWNNPLRYNDLTGEYVIVDDLIAAAIGGTVNLIGNAIAGNVNSWGQGFSYFGVGAVAGWTTIYAGPVVGGMIVAGGNSVVQQSFEYGFGNISWEQVGNSTMMGGITGAISAGVGGLVQAPLNSAFSGIASPVLRQSLIQSSVGTASGFVTNTTMAKINGSNWGEALSAGRDGAIWGATFGFAGGAVTGLRYARKEGLSPWTGRDKLTIDKVFDNPKILKGVSKEAVQRQLGNTEGWEEGTLRAGRSEGQGWTLRELNSQKTDYTDRYIQYSPGSSRHYNGDPYFKVSSGKTGTIRFPASK